MDVKSIYKSVLAALGAYAHGMDSQDTEEMIASNISSSLGGEGVTPNQSQSIASDESGAGRRY